MNPTGGPGDGVAAGERRGRAGRWLLVAICIGLAAMWAFVFLNPWEYKNRIPDRGWVEQAEQVCAATGAELAGLPLASSFRGGTPADRAPSVKQANELLRAMVRSLRALPEPADDTSRALVTAWLADWDAHLADRDAHAEKLAANLDVRFTETASERGVPIAIRMNELARRNGMPSCQVPGDLA